MMFLQELLAPGAVQAEDDHMEWRSAATATVRHILGQSCTLDKLFYFIKKEFLFIQSLGLVKGSIIVSPTCASETPLVCYCL